jgi:Bacterial SH3 domain
MKKILALLLLIFAKNLFAQNTEGYGFAIIDDKDGFTNVREEPNVKSKIVGKIKEGELFFCFSNEKHKDWFAVDVKNNNNLSGYVHKSRIKFVEELPKLKKRKSIKDTIYIKNDSISLKMVIGDFKSAKHKLTKDNNFITKIDGKRPMGVDGGLPKTELQSIQLTMGDEVIDVPKSELNDLYQISFVSPDVYLGQNGDIYFTMANGDGAGSYVAAFAFKNKKFVSRYVFYSF